MLPSAEIFIELNPTPRLRRKKKDGFASPQINAVMWGLNSVLSFFRSYVWNANLSWMLFQMGCIFVSILVLFFSFLSKAISLNTPFNLVAFCTES